MQGYVAQVLRWTQDGKVFTVGDAGISSTDAIGEAAAANHDATKPSLLFYNPEGSGKVVTVLGLFIAQSGTVAGGRPELMCATDVGNRYSSGGAAKTPVNKRAGGPPSALLAYQAQSGGLLVATAASASVKYFNQLEIPQTVTAADAYPGLAFPGLAGALVIPPNYTFLVYCRAATTGMTFHWFLEWLEEAA